MEITKNYTKYKNEYKKLNYIRKELVFKKDEWQKIEIYLKENNTSLKKIILDKIINSR